METPAPSVPKLETKVERPAAGPGTPSEPKCKLCNGTGQIEDHGALQNKGCEQVSIFKICLQCRGSGKGTYAVK